MGCAAAPPHHPSRIEITGSRNLRDLGGYRTTDGKVVKKGVLYRSDHLDQITKADFEKIAALGVKTEYDLRGEAERTREPPRLPEIVPVKVVTLSVFYQGLEPWMTARKILGGDVEEGEFHDVMVEAYRSYVLDFRPQWSTLLKGLAEPGTLAALIHCTYGKDRTGVAVALVLRSLGVPQEKIMEDYLLSNKFWESKTELYSCLSNWASCFRTPRNEVRALMEVRPEYLQASFEAIDEHYGSFDNYLDQGLGIDEQTLQRLRAALLQ
ncbi:MAG: tyrosine-protein phosphatase [Deltaproteobacteria bacterium]|nr:tyrosine-protein phosphatase [Deltaproteobacteria bacterium]